MSYTPTGLNTDVEARALPVDTLDDFDAVYEAYYQAVYRAVRAIVLEAPLAEDVTQNAFLKAYRNRSRYQPNGSLSGWLHRIAVREAISTLRWHKVQEKLLGAMKLRAVQPVLDNSLSTQLIQVLEHLGPGTRAAVILHYYHGYRQREVASILGIPEGTVATRIANGLRKMRKVIEDH